MSERAKLAAKTAETKKETSTSRTKKTNFSPSISPPVGHILFLQRTVGNRAVQRLIKSGVIQARLTIGQPGDISGRDVVFGAGQYSPEATEGKKLLAHELTHAIQQKGGMIQPVIQRAPSTEVPDLDQKVVDEVKTALKGDNKEGALQGILNALVSIDPTKFDKSLLHENKLHTKAGSSSDTAQGPAFTAWLAGELAKGSADLKTDKTKVGAFLSKLTVPKDKLDIKVRIAEEAFENVPRLYNTIRHEWVHVEQFKAKPLEYISTSEFPSEYANPSESDVLQAREIEAYLWEAEHMDQTGIKNLPYDVWNTWNNLRRKWSGTSVRREKPFKARFGAAFKNTWEVAFEGYLKKAEKIISGAGSSGISEEELKQLEETNGYLTDMWGYRDNHNIAWSGFKDRYFAVKGTSLTKALADIEAKLKSGSITKGIDGLNLWEPTLKEWINLDASIQAAHKKRFSEIMPKLFDSTFVLFEKEFTEDYSRGDKSYLESKLEFMGNMLLNSEKSMVKRSEHTNYKKRLDKMKEQYKKMK